MKNYMGEELQLWFGEGTGATCIACATSCSINTNSDTIDVSCKDTSRYASSIAGKVSWDISTDALFCIPGEDDSRYGYKKLMDALINGDELTVTWASVSNYAEANATTATTADESGHVFNKENLQESADDLFYGKAIVTSCSLTADNGSVATYSVSLQGKGKINSGGKGYKKETADAGE